jgi:hypothetical protein
MALVGIMEDTMRRARQRECTARVHIPLCDDRGDPGRRR